MAHFLCRSTCRFALLATLWLPAGSAFAQDQGKAADELADFKTVETASTAKPGKVDLAGEPQPGYLGVHLTRDQLGRLVLAHVDPTSPAGRVGLQIGDRLLKAASLALQAPEELTALLQGKGPGDSVKLEVLRGEKALVVTPNLAAPSTPEKSESDKPMPGKGGFDVRKAMNPWKKATYRLAVVQIEYSDAKHNEAIQPAHWEEALFSRNTHTKTNATGQKVYGSLRDYYHEQSYGGLTVDGKVFQPVLASKKRLEYGQGTNRTALLVEALDKLLERDGKKALDGFDGIFFMYAGGRTQVARGSLYWPHKSNFSHQGKRWSYFICPEGGKTMGNISVICHEFGHMLGLPDLYAAPERPGSEGLGQWCLMSNQAPGGRPQHMSAWCKERLGWLTPTVLDPTRKQKLILSPIYKSGKECYKILARADGGEHFLLENRTGQGFDASLPAHGLLVWRVIRGRPTLEESHGVAGPSGPRTAPSMTPFPSKANDAFTPFTTPSSRSQLGEGLPVHITNIRRLPDGRVTFYVGYEFY